MIGIDPTSAPAPINPVAALAMSLGEAAIDTLSRRLEPAQAWALVRRKLIAKLPEADAQADVLRVLASMGRIDLAAGFTSPATRCLRVAGEMLTFSASLFEQAQLIAAASARASAPEEESRE